MKKSILKAFLVLAICAAAASANASVDITSTTSIGSLSFSPSSKVHVYATSATTGYVVEALHISGSRVFGTDSAASILYWHDAVINPTAPSSAWAASPDVAPTAAGIHGTPNFVTGTTWTSM
jgi:hypothetical protein